MSLLIQQATLKDVDFILSLIMNGARKGHFSKDVLTNKAHMRENIFRIVKCNVSKKGIASEAFLGVLSEKKVGAAIIRKMNGYIELEFIAISTSFKGKGIGTMFLDGILRRYIQLHTLVAYCFPSSNILKHMLMKKGFTLSGEFEGAEILIHKVKPKDTDSAPVFVSSALDVLELASGVIKR